ncbi:MAG TPA: translation initiation factor eIF-2B [Candidatus Absconditabacterales bacterium]|nr:translation initiation factor eIF-2B [Candidatus Absconditabacterales bacterium]
MFDQKKLEKILIVTKDIKDIKIQGATNIAKEAFKIIKSETENQSFSSKEELEKFLRESSELLINARETEPMLFNGMKYARFSFQKNKEKSLEELKKIIIDSFDFFLNLIKQEKIQRAEIGSELVKDGMTIFTHCHSSSVVELLLKAKEKEKKFIVYNSETRPLFQGRKTSAELVSGGIDTTMVADGAGAYLINNSVEKHVNINMIFLGADAIKLNGDVMNKVGSFAIGLSAFHSHIPVYIVGSLAKIDTVDTVDIEMRDSKEIRPEAPAGLKIANYAFDTIPAEFITGIITEFGVIKPSDLKKTLEEKYPRMTDK